MALFLDAGAADFEAKFAALLAAKREAATDVDDAVAKIIADVRARGDAALKEYSLRFDRIDFEAQSLRVSAGEIDAALAASPAEAIAALEFAHARILAYHRRQAPRDESFTDALGVKLGWRWTADLGGRALRAGGRGELSLLGADERGAGQSRGLRADRDGRAGAGRPAQSAGAGGGAHRRRRRDLPRRRRAGDRGAGLWHGDDRAGGQDRRARQRLCRGGQAAGVRRRRHRHDRRTFRGRRAGRRRRRSRLRRRRPAGPGRARRGGAIDPDHRRRPARPPGRRRGRAGSSASCRAQRSPARAGATTARSSW